MSCGLRATMFSHLRHALFFGFRRVDFGISPSLIRKMMSAGAAVGSLPSGLRPHPRKLLYVHCVKQLAKYPKRVCRIRSGRITCSYCKNGHKKCRPVGIVAPTSGSRLTQAGPWPVHPLGPEVDPRCRSSAVASRHVRRSCAGGPL